MERNFSAFLLISLVLHYLFFVLFFFTKTFHIQRYHSEEKVVFMNVVSLAEINNIKLRLQKKSNLPHLENAKKVAKLEAKKEIKHEAIKSLVKDQNIKLEDKRQPENITQETKLQIPLEKLSQVSKANKTEEVQKVKQDIKKNETLKIKKVATADKTNGQKQIDLKKLEKIYSTNNQTTKEKPSEGIKLKSNKKSGSTNKDKEDSSSQNYNSDMKEMAKATALLRDKIESNWHKPLSMRDYNNLKVRVKLIIDINQAVQSISDFAFLEESVPESVKNAIEDSIIRAIRLSEPFDFFNLQQYEYWREINFVFSYY